jgi:hypothetical protein
MSGLNSIGRVLDCSLIAKLSNTRESNTCRGYVKHNSSSQRFDSVRPDGYNFTLYV